MQGKKVLIIYCHPEQKSFTHAVKEAVQKSLTAAGASVDVTDLYAQKFDPVIRAEDFQNRKDKEHLSIISEQMFSVANGKTYQKAIDSLPSDVKHELAKLLAADYVISISPIWWGSSPAMLTGYFDKVFVAGATWGFGEGKPIGMLKGKKALNIFLAGAPEVAYKQGAPQGQDFKDRVQHITQSTFAYCGFDVFQFKAYFGVSSATDDVRKGWLQDISAYVSKLEQQPILHQGA